MTDEEREIRKQIKVGDRVTLMEKIKLFNIGSPDDRVIREEEKTILITADNFFIPSDFEILKVEKIGPEGWQGYYEKIKEEILDDTEKEYLENLIRPFKKNVTSITKKEDYNRKNFIRITLFEGSRLEDIDLPDFKPETMYKSMELGKRYTLKELGLEK